MLPTTVNARLLLGWMEKEDGLRCLLEDCSFSPSLSPSDAAGMWAAARRAVEALPPAPGCRNPQRHKLNSAEHKAVQQFRKKFARATDIVDFLKIDPMDLIIHQLFIVPEMSESFQARVAGEEWLRTALLEVQNQAPVSWRVERDQVVFDLPHGEFFLAGPQLPDARLQLMQHPAFATVAPLEDRLLLANGYHRAFALASRVPGKPALFACSAALPHASTASTGAPRPALLAPRPPLFGDFFDERLYVSVRMKRRKRFEMRVRAELVSIYEEAQG